MAFEFGFYTSGPSIAASNPSGFGVSSLFDQLAAGDCTSCRVTQDKSAYWHPQLYFRDDTTNQYEEVNPLGGMLA